MSVKEADILQDWTNGGLFRLTCASPAMSVPAGATILRNLGRNYGNCTNQWFIIWSMRLRGTNLNDYV